MTNTVKAPQTFSLGVAGVGVAHFTVNRWRDGRVSSYEIRTDEFHVYLRPRYGRIWERDYTKFSRVYGMAFVDARWAEIETTLCMYALERERSGALKGKCPVLAAHQREGKKAMIAGVKASQAAIEAVLGAVGLESVGLHDELELKFSARAGCGSCPCSPGFVSDRRVSVGIGYDMRPVDLDFGG